MEKTLCKPCIELVYKEETGACEDLNSGVKKEMKAIQSMLLNLETPKQPAKVLLTLPPVEWEGSDSLEERSSSLFQRFQGTKSLLLEVDALQGVIYETLEIKEQAALSLHDHIYQTLKRGSRQGISGAQSTITLKKKKKVGRPGENIFFPQELEMEVPLQ